MDAKGRQRKSYPYKLMMTPHEKLKSLAQAKQYLSPLISFQVSMHSPPQSATMTALSV